MKAFTRPRRAVDFLACFLLLSLAAACGAPLEDLLLDGGSGSGGAAGSRLDDASGPKDDGGVRDGQGDGTARNDVGQPPALDGAATGGAGGTGNGGAAGTGGAGGTGNGGAAGTGGAGGTGNDGAAGTGNGGAAGTGGAGSGGAAGSGGSSGPDGSARDGDAAGSGGAPGDASHPDADAGMPDASADMFDGGSIDGDAGTGGDAPIVCDKPAAAGGVFDDSTIGSLAGVTHVAGSLTISLATATDLNVLRCLQRVDGDLKIQNCSALITASLPQLQTVSGALELESDRVVTSIALPMLSTIQGRLRLYLDSSLKSFVLPALATVNGNVEIELNDALETMTLPVLSSIGGMLFVENEGYLETIALPELTAVGEDQGISIHLLYLHFLQSILAPKLVSTSAAIELDTITGNWTPSSPPKLDFGSLQTVGGHFTLRAVALLESLAGFAQLTTVNGDVALHSNYKLLSATLPSLATVTGGIDVEWDPVLSSVALPALTSLGQGDWWSIQFDVVPALTSISVPRLASIPGPFYIHHAAGWPPTSSPLVVDFGALTNIGNTTDISNPNLQDLSGFARLTTIRGALLLNDNVGLASVSLPQLASVVGEIQIHRNEKLATVALPALTTVGQGPSGGIGLSDLPILSSVALPRLATTTSDIVLLDIGGAMPAPVNMVLDMSALTSVGGRLHVQNVRNLQRLGVPQLAAVRDSITISMNDGLTELHPPASIVPVIYVEISNNPALPTCSANAFAMRCSVTAGATVSGNKVDACGG